MFQMREPKYPLFVFDGLDLMVVASHKRLQGDIEPVDVRLGEFEVFDSDGRRVKLETKTWAGTEAEINLEEPPASAKFSEKLREFLRAVNDAVVDDAECDLPCLIEAAKRRSS
jgi:hypothetical protein